MLEQSPSAIELEVDAELTGTETQPAPKSRPPRKKRLGVGAWMALFWLTVVLLGGIFIPIFVHSNANVNAAKGWAGQGILKVPGYPLGFDRNGNDMLLQLAKGARNSMTVGLGAVSFGLLVGGSLGLMAGYFKGNVDTGLTTVFNVLLAIPQFVLALALVTVMANTQVDASGAQHAPSALRRLIVLVFALGIVSVPLLGRITRANSLQWSQRDFVLASRSQGATNRRVMVREVLPNVLPAMFSIALLAVAVVIVVEGGLSILGVGVLPPAVSWGNMIALGRNDLRNLPYEVFEPIACIFFTVLSLNFLGDVVRSRFDVRESAL